jgi:DNA-binding GntR family transcriptional regulator
LYAAAKRAGAKEHGELIDLCRKRRKRAAKALLLQHIVGVEEDLVEQLSF